jgi:multiple sugar transport system substrate-binding protein
MHLKLKKGGIPLTKQQIIFVSVTGGIILIFVLILVGVLPGRRPTILRNDLVVWGAGDESRIWQSTINKFNSTYRTVDVEYVSINADNYEAELLNALAAGRGPDVFMFKSSWLPKHGNKITPISSEKLTPVTFAGLFPQVAEEDFVADGRIYALPISVDTLAMAYNRDIFDRNQIVFPPKTWDEFEGVVSKLRIIENGGVTQPAAAIGGTSESVGNAPDILSAIMLQYGTPMVNDSFNRADFSPGGEEALARYTQFGNPSSIGTYTWRDNLGDANELFANEEVAITFVYSDDLSEIRAINPFVDFEVRPLPQLDITNPVNYANYWGLAVSTQSEIPETAWDFVVFAATDLESAQEYTSRTNRPPALRLLIENYLTNPDIGVFAAQALTAKSWPQIDDNAVTSIFDDMIEAITSGELTVTKALSQGRGELTQLMRGQ